MGRTINIQTLIVLICLITVLPMAASSQIDFRRPGSMKDKVVQKPEAEQPPVRTAPNGEELNNASAQGLRDFVVEPDENKAVIRFKAPAGSSPVVEVALEPPTLGPSGKLEFSTRLSLVKAEIVTDKRALQQINYIADLSNLERGTSYYYLVSTSDAKLQTRGRFATSKLKANVTVVFTEISVIRGEAGIFDFWVGDKHLGWIGSTDKMLDWDSDSGSHGIEKSIEIPDAPDSLEILVNVCTDTSYFFENNGCAGLHAVPTREPVKNSSSETNAALRSINIKEISGKEGRQDFELESVQSGKVEVAFKVRGYIQINRG